LTAAQPQKISPKMPFYAHEDITCFAFAAITECHENYDKDEQRENKKVIEDIVYNHNHRALKNMCEEYLDICVRDEGMFFTAVLNSINLDNLNSYLRDWLDDLNIDELDEDSDGSS
jgi:hypothetical protein